jgi:hypothetical protein
VLKNIYGNVESSVLLGDMRTDFFKIEVGVKQGCLLSPALFDIFVNELGEEINKLGKGVQCGNKRISLLLFADDIVLIAESKEDLELMLKVAYVWSLKWRCKYNYDKCAVIVFDNKKHEPLSYDKCEKNCTCGHHWFFGPHFIKQVLSYKYLGVELDNRLSYKEFKARLLNKSRMNMGRIWAMGIRSGYLSIKASMNLWQSLVRSILEYSCEIWGDEIWREGEQVQLDMARRILRCSTKTTKEAVLGELGLCTLRSRRDLKKLIYWIHVLSLPDTRFLKQAYLFSRSKKKKNWARSIRDILHKYNLSDLYSDESKIWNLDGKGNAEAKSVQDHKRFWRQFITKKIFCYEEKVWLEGMKAKDKLRTYRYFKTNLRCEKYLDTRGDFRGRVLMTSLRTGTNTLQIERGRWKQQKEEERVCTQCQMNRVENEMHFVVECPKYDRSRKELFENINSISKHKWTLEKRSFKEQFLLLMNGTGDQFELPIFSVFQSFLIKAFKQRIVNN